MSRRYPSAPPAEIGAPGELLGRLSTWRHAWATIQQTPSTRRRRVEHLSALCRPDRCALRMEMQRKTSAGVRRWSAMLSATDAEVPQVKKVS